MIDMEKNEAERGLDLNMFGDPNAMRIYMEKNR